MSVLDCCSPCPVVRVENVPGGQGDPGTDGTNGINAFAFVGGVGFTVPAIGATVGVTLDTSQWMVIGQKVVVDGPATFEVESVPTNTSATLKFMGYFGDVAPGTAIAAGAKVSPAGVSGAIVGTVATSSPADPTGTADATGKMMGLAGAITPTFSGRVLIIITGILENDTATDGSSVQIRYGTGAAPSNGDALTGTTLGKLKNMVAATGPGKQGIALASVVSGLTVATAYWIDVGLKAVTGGNAALYDVDIVAEEL